VKVGFQGKKKLQSQCAEGARTLFLKPESSQGVAGKSREEIVRIAEPLANHLKRT
jgi:hypothetical protein